MYAARATRVGAPVPAWRYGVPEIDQLRGEDFNKDEAARLGNRLGADYIIVGSITKAVEP
jgi:hypothetical protein